ncbi:polysaccharide deacetylase family protein [Streptomyces pseudogriseolus]|uniref:polysaccharide deacetylase family protein n=1 Tax=Streptomyces pseudogriseolus TaxID=36817 RepID=UPI003FA264D7
MRRRRGTLPAVPAVLALLAATAGCAAPAGAGDVSSRAAGTASAVAPAPLPPVVDHVTTDEPVVFLTYDDGAERDPRFIDLVRERGLPVGMFLTDSVTGPGYGHFARLRAVGATLQNHTLDHPALPGLPLAAQRAQICGQQRKLAARFGVRPRLFRPPYGRYDTATLRAAAECGIAAVVLWRVTLEPDGHLTYHHGPHHLIPGDIIAVPSGEAPPLSLAERTTRLLGELEERGLRVGRLEDHVGRHPSPATPGSPAASSPSGATASPSAASGPTRATSSPSGV